MHTSVPLTSDVHV